MATVIFQKAERQTLGRADALLRRLQELLPPAIVREAEKYLCGHASARGRLEEIRLRTERRVYFTVGKDGRKQNIMLDVRISHGELTKIFDRMCDGSLYAYSESIIKGYISVGCGIRVGVCGRASVESGRIVGVYSVSSLNLRMPCHCAPIDERLGTAVAECVRRTEGVLIYSPPAQGKTTLLRSLCTRLTSGARPMRVALVDTREEFGFLANEHELSVDVLTGYPKAEAIAIATAFMNPEVIICDEIGSPDEAKSIAAAQNCGVPLIATAHGEDICSLMRRPSMLELHKIRAFGLYMGIRISRAGGFDSVFHTGEEVDALLADNKNNRNGLPARLRSGM